MPTSTCSGYANSAIAYNATTYLPLAGGANSSTTEDYVQLSVYDSVTFSLFSVYVPTNTCNGNRNVRVRDTKGNGNEVVSVTAATTGLFRDTSNTDALTDGDEICAVIETAGTSGTTATAWDSIDVAETTNNMSYVSIRNGAAIAEPVTTYQGTTTVTVDTTEANITATHPESTTWQDLTAYCSATDVSTTTIRSRKNSGNGAQVLSIVGTGWLADNSHSDSIAAGDEVNYSIVTTSTGGTRYCTLQIISSCFIDTEYFLTGGSGTSTTANADLYYSPFNSPTSNAAESGTRQLKYGVSGQNYTVSNLHIYVPTNSANTNQPFLSRVDGGNGNLSISITAATTGQFQDTTHSDVLTSAKLFNYMLDWAGGTGSLIVMGIWARVARAAGSTSYTKTFSFDACLQKSLTKAFSFDGWLQKNGITKGFTFDGVLLYQKTKDFSFDAALQKALTKAFSFDATLQKALVKQFSFDGMLTGTGTKPFTFDATLQKGLTKAFSFDGVTLLQRTKDFSFDGVTLLQKTKDISFDGVTLLQKTKDFTFDSTLQKEGTKPFSFDAALQKELTKDFSFDGVLVSGAGKNFSFDGELQKSLTKDLTFDGVLKLERAKDFSFDAALQKENTKTLSFDAQLQKELTKPFTFDATLQKEATKTFSYDALLQKPLTKDFTFDGVLNLEKTKTFTFDALLQQALEHAFTFDAVLAATGAGTQTFTFDACLQKSLVKTFTFDAVLEAVAPIIIAPPTQGDKWATKPKGPPAKMGLPKRKWELIKQFLEAELGE